jgi:hypothetical protein
VCRNRFSAFFWFLLPFTIPSSFPIFSHFSCLLSHLFLFTASILQGFHPQLGPRPDLLRPPVTNCFLVMCLITASSPGSIASYTVIRHAPSPSPASTESQKQIAQWVKTARGCQRLTQFQKV